MTVRRQLSEKACKEAEVRVSRWLSDPKAMKQLQRSMKKAEKMCESIDKMMKVEPMSLLTPFDI